MGLRQELKFLVISHRHKYKYIKINKLYIYMVFLNDSTFFFKNIDKLSDELIDIIYSYIPKSVTIFSYTSLTSGPYFYNIKI
jgi:hypothetical protein